MARIVVLVERAALARETEALRQCMEASSLVRDEVHALAERGIGMVEIISVPCAARGTARLRQQLADPYWHILEREAV